MYRDGIRPKFGGHLVPVTLRSAEIQAVFKKRKLQTADVSKSWQFVFLVLFYLESKLKYLLDEIEDVNYSFNI